MLILACRLAASFNAFAAGWRKRGRFFPAPSFFASIEAGGRVWLERECEAELRGTHSQAELGNDIGLMGALLPFVLEVVAGACVGRRSGQPRMPPRERQHEGL